MWRRRSELIEPIATTIPADYNLQEQLATDLYWLGGLEDRLDRVDESLADFRRAAAIFERMVCAKPEHRLRCELGTSYHVIGRLLADSGRSSEAIEPYRRAIVHRERLRATTRKTSAGRAIAGSWFRLGEAMESQGRIAAAVEAYQTCLVYQRQVRAQEPREVKHRTFLDERLRRLFWLLIALAGRPRRWTWPGNESHLSSGKLAASLPH